MAYKQMEKDSRSFFWDYLVGLPDVSLRGIQEVERVANEAPPKTWDAMDKGTYMGFVHGRMSLALVKAGLTNDAIKYRSLAIEEFRHQKRWNSEQQKMLPLSPVPTVEETESSLFSFIPKLDETLRRHYAAAGNSLVASNGLKCHVSPTKRTFTSTETILLDFTVENSSTSNIYFMASHLDRFVDLTLGGKSIRRTDYKADWDFKESKDSFVLIEPGKTWTIQIDISKNWLPESPLKTGTMVVRYSNTNKDGHNVGVNGWTGTLLSNEFILTIKTSQS